MILIPKNIQEKVLSGLVLSDNGEWMKIAEAVNMQKNLKSNVTEEIPVHYIEVIENARNSAFGIDGKTAQNADTQENYIDYAPETVCIDAIPVDEITRETVLYESIPDSGQNIISSINGSDICTASGGKQNDSTEIQKAINNINKLISRKQNGVQKSGSH
jgi:hypothetical protein